MNKDIELLKSKISKEISKNLRIDYCEGEKYFKACFHDTKDELKWAAMKFEMPRNYSEYKQYREYFIKNTVMSGANLELWYCE